MESPRENESDAELQGDTSGSLTVATDATVVILGRHSGSVEVSGGGTLVVRGELRGAVTVESLGTATIEGDVVGPVEIRVAGTVVIEAGGRVEGVLVNFGSCTNRGLRSGRVEGRTPDDQPGSQVLEPSANGTYPALPPRA